jgi:hypothetical protein
MPLRLIRDSLRDPLALAVGIPVAAIVSFFAMRSFIWTAAITVVIVAVLVRILYLTERSGPRPPSG